MDRHWNIEALVIPSYEGNISFNMEFGVYTKFGMDNFNMDRNWRIDTLTVRSLNDQENYEWRWYQIKMECGVYT